MADTFFVGQTHDAYQVAAVSLTNLVFVMYMAIANLLGYCYGAANKKRFVAIMKFSGMLTAVCGTVLSAVYILCSRQIVGLFINDAEVVAFGTGTVRFRQHCFRAAGGQLYADCGRLSVDCDFLAFVKKFFEGAEG